MILCLVRVSQGDWTGGVLIPADTLAPFAVTLELPWKGNQSDVSCIPAGRYYCEPWVSPKKGPVIRLMNVPGRTNVLMHKGNVEADSAGCILVGEAFEPVKGQDGITGSADGFAELLAWATGPFTLEVYDPPEVLRRTNTEG